MHRYLIYVHLIAHHVCFVGVLLKLLRVYNMNMSFIIHNNGIRNDIVMIYMCYILICFLTSSKNESGPATRNTTLTNKHRRGVHL